MATPYSLPRKAPQADTARVGRLALVLCVLALCLLAAILPADERPMATVPESVPAAAATAVGA